MGNAVSIPRKRWLLLVAVLLYLRSKRFPKGLKQRKPEEGQTFVHLSHGRVHYRQTGQGKNIVVLIHGFSTPSVVFDTIRKGLEGRNTVITFDNYGRGYSDGPDTPNTGELFVGQLAELLYCLRISCPVDVVGYSMGGAIAALFAGRYPQSVNRLVLMAPAGLPVHMGAGVAGLVATPWLGEALFKAIAVRTLLAAAAKEWVHPSRCREHTEAIRKIVAQCGSSHAGYARSLFSTLQHFPMQDIRNALAVIRANRTPTKLIWGDIDTVCPYRNAAVMKELIGPTCELETISPGAHSFVIEFPERTICALRSFLDRE